MFQSVIAPQIILNFKSQLPGFDLSILISTPRSARSYLFRYLKLYLDERALVKVVTVLCLSRCRDMMHPKLSFRKKLSWPAHFWTIRCNSSCVALERNCNGLAYTISILAHKATICNPGNSRYALAHSRLLARK
jgi:hypothetical protein